MINYDDDIGAPWGSPGNANGVLMQDGWITAGFNALNQPMYIWAASSGWINFAYDPLGRCVKRWTDTAATYLYYDGWNLIQEGPASGGILWDGWASYPGGAGGASRFYLPGARTDELVISANMFTGQFVYHQDDAMGNALMLTSDGGGLVEQYFFDAFGYPYFYSGTNGWTGNIGYSEFGNRFLFTGREWLSDLRLYDYRNRLYQPELGRFLQPDPKEFSAGDYNLYRYCHNDPVNRTDPTGLIHEGPLGPEPEITEEGRPYALAAAGLSLGIVAAPALIDAGGAAVLSLAMRSPLAARVVAIGTAAVRAVSQHGSDRLEGTATRGGVLSFAQARVIQAYGMRLTQADGARVSVVQVGGRYYVAVFGRNGYVTGFGGTSGIDKKAFDNLAKRYGYH